MDRRKVIGLMSLSAGAYAKLSVRDRFNGVWKLVSCEQKFKGGTVDYPYGEKPVGRLT